MCAASLDACAAIGGGHGATLTAVPAVKRRLPTGRRLTGMRCHNHTMDKQRVAIQSQDFNLADEVAALRMGDRRVGAVCSFIGTVRDRNDGSDVSTLELEHYPGMTEKAIEAMLDEAHRRFDIFASRVVHRIGVLQPLDQIVLVAVSSSHRGESFQACEFIMDYLKTQAPFWKKEQTPQGARWVDARVADDAALQRWGITASNG
jgi:molybdopterin synthase catalytic subunit